MACRSNEHSDLKSILPFTQHSHAFDRIVFTGICVNTRLIRTHERIEFQFVANGRWNSDRLEACLLGFQVLVVRLDGGGEFKVLLRVFVTAVYKLERECVYSIGSLERTPDVQF